jgi:DNA-binding LytR/AlgR family response regulator
MNVAIVDDQKEWQDNIEERIFNIYPNVEISKYNSGENFLADKKNHSVVFMDVNLGGMDGLETGREYLATHPNTKLILTTAYKGYAEKGYKINAFDFVDKCHLDNIVEAYTSAIRTLKQMKLITIKTVLGERMVTIKEIVYIEVIGKRRYIKLINETLESNESLESLLALLDGAGFFKSCRSFGINLSYVYQRDNLWIKMKDGKKVPLSRGKTGHYEEALSKWNFG